MYADKLKFEAEIEKKDIEEAGKTNKQKKREQREMEKKMSAAADMKQRQIDMADDAECAKHKAKAAAEEAEKEEERAAAELRQRKAMDNGNDYAANMPEHHLKVKAETWQWKTKEVPISKVDDLAPNGDAEIQLHQKEARK